MSGSKIKLSALCSSYYVCMTMSMEAIHARSLSTGQAPDELLINVVEPPPCLYPFTAESDGLHYCWRGHGRNMRTNSLSVYECSTEQWHFELTTGPAPPGLWSGCSVCVGRCLYTFGGTNGPTFFNDISKLNLDTLQWSEVQTTGSQPIKKTGSGLVRVDERILCCIGGYGIGPTQPGSVFTRNAEYSDIRGWTNEIHLFNIQDGIWSVPQFGGERPPPRVGFTFTKVDQYRAVLFGGRLTDLSMVNTHYLIDFRSMEITKVEPVEGEPCPVGRTIHAACCLNYGEEHPQILVHGGLGDSHSTLDDMWILDIDTGKWTEVTLPESMKSRYGHSLTATSLGPGLSEVLMFGGKQMWKGASIAKTMILRLEFSGPSTGRWSLVGVASNEARGSTHRLTEKVLRIEQAKTRCTDISFPDDRVRALEEKLHALEQREREIQQCCDRLLLEKDQELIAKDQELAATKDDTERQVSEATVNARRRVHDLTATVQQLQEDLRRSDRRAQLAEERAESLETQWVVRRNEIVLTETKLGGGGWGKVKVAKFRGIEVAAKMLYTQIQSDYNRHLFIREMNMAAKLRHPNLVQFIGATLEGEMIILTELMATSLRKMLQKGDIPRKHILSICVQVCQALNYLHLIKPNPVIHRDISSANVLLNPLPNDCWRVKVTDYGSVNTEHLLNTANPGNPVYAAPEAQDPYLQSTKMDIFSLGVLMIEICAGRFPSNEDRERLLLTIQDRAFSDIISHCIDKERDNRPTAGNLLTLLHDTK